jgi:hypothetical protein
VRELLLKKKMGPAVERVSRSQRRVARKGCAFKKNKKSILQGSGETNGVGIMIAYSGVFLAYSFSYMEPLLLYSEAWSLF